MKEFDLSLAESYANRKAFMYSLERYLKQVKDECRSLRHSLSCKGCVVETSVHSDSVSIRFSFPYSKPLTLERTFSKFEDFRR